LAERRFSLTQILNGALETQAVWRLLCHVARLDHFRRSAAQLIPAHRRLDVVERPVDIPSLAVGVREIRRGVGATRASIA